MKPELKNSMNRLKIYLKKCKQNYRKQEVKDNKSRGAV